MHPVLRFVHDECTAGCTCDVSKCAKLDIIDMDIIYHSVFLHISNELGNLQKMGFTFWLQWLQNGMKGLLTSLRICFYFNLKQG